MRKIGPPENGAKSRIFCSLTNGTETIAVGVPTLPMMARTLILFNQLPHIGPGASWFVPIIERNEPQLATVDATVTVCAFQAGQDTPLHVFAQVSSVAG